MTRTDETEVVVGTLTADSQGGVNSTDGKSPSYTDTEVTENERSIRFWNTITVSDTDTNSKQRKFRVRVRVVGHGVDTSGSWVEHPYSSPLASTPLQPDKTFNVPDQDLPKYDFTVTGPWELYEMQSGTYNLIDSGGQGPETATVNDDSSGS